MSHRLAKGWAEIELREHVYIAGRIGWRGLKADEYKPAGPIFLSVPNLNHGDEVDFGKVYHITQARYEESPEIQLRVGDTLLVKDGAGIGKLGFVANLPGPATVNSSLLVVRPANELLENKYLFYYLKGPKFQQIALERISGSATPHLFQKDIKKLQVLAPPRNEQRRIAAKLEALLGKVDDSQQRLAKIPVLLKRFRQSVLAAACSGRLTADWREENPSDGTTEDDDLPRGWRRTTVEDLIPKGGIFDGPFGSNLKSDDYTESGVRVIRLENIGQLRFIGEKETFISREKYETLKRHTVGEGDIIFASFIMEEVRACVLPKLSTKAIAKADCFCLRPRPELVDRQFLVFQLISQKSYNMLVEDVHGATRPRINTTQLRKLEVRVCPLPEQQEIVRRVEGLFALADQLEVRLAKARGQVDKLTPSLLARAFAGQLVPQDPTDQPAEMLLERIRSPRKE